MTDDGAFFATCLYCGQHIIRFRSNEETLERDPWVHNNTLWTRCNSRQILGFRDVATPVPYIIEEMAL